MKTPTRPIEGAEAVADDRTIGAMVARAHRGIARAMKTVRRPEARIGVIETPVGGLMIAEGPAGLAAVDFLATKQPDRTIAMLRYRFDLVENGAWMTDLERALKSYFGGDTAILERPVDLTLVESEFQRRALTRLRAVPSGAVITYHGLAAAIGEPEANRAIGNTMASNPIPLFVPCHRVIRSDGSIGNYGGGVERKILLLRTEGFEIGGDLRVPPRAVLGHRHTHIFCRPECSAARRANRDNVLIFADAGHAADAGLRPCKLCRPADVAPK